MSLATQAVSVVSNAIADIKLTWKYMIYVALIALGIALLSMLIIRFFAGIFVWLTLLIFIGCFFALAIYAGKESSNLSQAGPVGTSGSSSYYNANNLFAASIICYVIAGLSVIIVLFYMSTIQLCVAVIKSAALFIAQTFWIILLPIIFTGLTLGYFIVWLVVLGYLWSVGNLSKRTGTPFAVVNWSQWNTFLVVAHFFAVLWNIAFLQYFQLFMIACTCVIWFYNSKGSQGYFSFPIWTSLYWAFRYHLGSISLGAFILAIIWGIQLVLAYVSSRVQSMQSGGDSSRIV